MSKTQNIVTKKLIASAVLLAVFIPLAYVAMLKSSISMLESFGDNYLLWTAFIVVVVTVTLLLLYRHLKSKKANYLYKLFCLYGVVAALMLIPFVFFINTAYPSVRQIGFSSETWNSVEAAQAGYPRKVNMIESLKTDFLHLGMSKASVAELINDCGDVSGDVCSTYLGPQRGTDGGSGGAWLDIMFDQDKVSSVQELVK